MLLFQTLWLNICTTLVFLVKLFILHILCMISTASPLLDVIVLVSIEIMSTQTDIVCQPNISRFYRMLSKIFFLHTWCLYNLQNLYILKNFCSHCFFNIQVYIIVFSLCLKVTSLTDGLAHSL